MLRKAFAVGSVVFALISGAAIPPDARAQPSNSRSKARTRKKPVAETPAPADLSHLPQPAEDGSVRVVDLPMPAPILLPTPSGRLVVCVQWVQNEFRWRDQFGGKSLVRIAVVDLESMSVTATRELDPAEMRLVAGSEALYVADPAAKKVRALSLADLAETRTAEWDAGPAELIVVADRLLCTKQGRMRLDLPGLTPTTRWKPLPAVVPRSGEDFVARVEGGWHLDGIIYDETLSNPRFVVSHPFASNGDYRPWLIPWRATPPTPHVEQPETLVNQAISGDSPFLVYATIAPAPPERKVLPVSLKVLDFTGVPIAGQNAGGFPAEFRLGGGQRVMINPYLLVAATGNPVSPPMFGGPHHNLIPLSTAGRKVLAVIDGRLLSWELDDGVVEKMSASTRLLVDSPVVAAGADAPLVIRHTLVGGVAPERVEGVAGTVVDDQGQVTLEPGSIVAPEKVDKFLSRLPRQTPDDLDRTLAASDALIERLTGRPAKGLAMLQRVEVQATDGGQSAPPAARLVHYAVFETPASARDGLIAKKKKVAEESRVIAAQNAERERQELADLEKRRAESQRRPAEAQRPPPPATASGPTMTRRLIGLATPFVAAAMVVAFLIFMWVPPTRPRHWGLLIAVSGFLPLLAAFGIGSALEPWRNTTKLWFEQAVFPATLVFLGLMLMTGTTVAAMEKGHSGITGFLLGLISPLGLLIVVLMPSQLSDPEPDRVVRPLPKKPRRRE